MLFHQAISQPVDQILAAQPLRDTPGPRRDQLHADVGGSVVASHVAGHDDNLLAPFSQQIDDLLRVWHGPRKAIQLKIDDEKPHDILLFVSGYQSTISVIATSLARSRKSAIFRIARTFLVSFSSLYNMNPCDRSM